MNISTRLFRIVLLPAGLILWVAAGCTPSDEPPAEPTATVSATLDMPPLETRADSLAMQTYEALGGPEAWAALPVLRFDFGFEQDGARTVARKHLWNRLTGDYRIETTVGADSNYVICFNVNTRDGAVYLNGQPVMGADRDERLQGAYRGFINDTYWFLAPVKMLDPGVNRTYVADSSTAELDVVHLTFGDVGLTPGDQYWMYIDKATGRLARWAFVLQGNPDAPPRVYDWEGYTELSTPAGPVYVSTRKEGGGRALLTDGVASYMEPPEGMMTSTTPML